PFSSAASAQAWLARFPQATRPQVRAESGPDALRGGGKVKPSLNGAAFPTQAPDALPDGIRLTILLAGQEPSSYDRMPFPTLEGPVLKSARNQMGAGAGQVFLVWKGAEENGGNHGRRRQVGNELEACADS